MGFAPGAIAPRSPHTLNDAALRATPPSLHQGSVTHRRVRGLSVYCYNLSVAVPSLAQVPRERCDLLVAPRRVRVLGVRHEVLDREGQPAAEGHARLAALEAALLGLSPLLALARPHGAILAPPFARRRDARGLAAVSLRRLQAEARRVDLRPAPPGLAEAHAHGELQRILLHACVVEQALAGVQQREARAQVARLGLEFFHLLRGLVARPVQLHAQLEVLLVHEAQLVLEDLGALLHLEDDALARGVALHERLVALAQQRRLALRAALQLEGLGLGGGLVLEVQHELLDVVRQRGHLLVRRAQRVLRAVLGLLFLAVPRGEVRRAHAQRLHVVRRALVLVAPPRFSRALALRDDGERRLGELRQRIVERRRVLVLGQAVRHHLAHRVDLIRHAVVLLLPLQVLLVARLCARGGGARLRRRSRCGAGRS
mmetsp:Transcript_6303/g.17652  ORF Transcript_6303/g.17652 Transcript_6303/m.17652 type:complete len:429 (-) Transcript_6303:588-1874(-)